MLFSFLVSATAASKVALRGREIETYCSIASRVGIEISRRGTSKPRKLYQFPSDVITANGAAEIFLISEESESRILTYTRLLILYPNLPFRINIEKVFVDFKAAKRTFRCVNGASRCHL